MPRQENKELKWGYSTGACATALALSAWHYHQYKEELTQIEVLFLDDKKICIPLLPMDLSANTSALLNNKPQYLSANTSALLNNEPQYLSANTSALLNNEHKDLSVTILSATNLAGTTLSTISSAPFMRIRKDGGDDPDCTHNAVLFASLEEAKLTDAMEADYILQIGHDTLIIHALSGIGVCTRLGLDCEKDHWAINQGPRKMLKINLEKMGMGACSQNPKTWILNLGVENGTELSNHTLNSHLGIIGGISILGTTGHVRPYSNAAYIETIRICVRSNKLSNQNHMVFCTGGRTQKTAKQQFSHLPETAFVSIGDFIGESIKSAHKYKMNNVTIACMGGKLCKYAAGFENTHAHNVKQDMQLLREQIILTLNSKQNCQSNTLASRQTNKHEDLCLELQKAQSVREALLYIPEDIRLLVLSKLADKALNFFHSLCPDLDFGILLCDFNGDIIFEKRKKYEEA